MVVRTDRKLFSSFTEFDSFSLLRKVALLDPGTDRMAYIATVLLLVMGIAGLWHGARKVGFGHLHLDGHCAYGAFLSEVITALNTRPAGAGPE